MKRRGFRGDHTYRLDHTAPDRYYGCPMYDLNATLAEGGRIYPCDVYQQPQHYFDMPGRGTVADRESWAAIARVRCRPTALVTIYRAVPRGVTTIHPGDWVTPSRTYAKIHATGIDATRGVVLSMKVPASTLFTDGNSLNEWGYDP